MASFSAAERQRLRGLWSSLARSSVIPDPYEVERLAPQAIASPWASPFEERWKSAALFALAQLALAFVRAPQRERLNIADALGQAAILARRLLDEEGPPQSALPFRADIDG